MGIARSVPTSSKWKSHIILFISKRSERSHFGSDGELTKMLVQWLGWKRQQKLCRIAVRGAAFNFHLSIYELQKIILLWQEVLATQLFRLLVRKYWDTVAVDGNQNWRT